MGRGGGQGISSDDPSSNPAEIFSFYSVNCLKKNKNKQNEAANGPFKKYFLDKTWIGSSHWTLNIIALRHAQAQHQSYITILIDLIDTTTIRILNLLFNF